MSAATVIAIRRKRLVRTYRDAGATDEGHSFTPEQLGQQRSWIFNQMVAHGVFVPTKDGRYFMKERAAVEFLAARRKRTLIIAGVFVVVFAILWLCGWMK